MRRDPHYILDAFGDISLALKSRSLWMALGWNDVRSRYHRSKLGAFWASLSILIFVSALGPIYSNLLGISLREYTTHLMLGLMLWGYISSIVLESGREYINSTNYLVSFRLSYFTLLMRVVWRNLVVFLYQLIVFIALTLILQLPITVSWIIAPFALLAITMVALWMALLMSVFATRFRDLSELVNNLLRLVFFVTPIMWIPSSNPQLSLVADLNPFYHLIEVFRAPVLTGDINLQNWVVVSAMLLVGWLLAFPIFAVFRSRIAFWL